ncbi:TTL-domain-containing protein [Russula earlei]|uniref:TTL-domain-containing protein n=1 Tax=Russula earlei TaxID=71964 RepID=A0ACC0UML9_9AGAM|nr:TTL-domain-containing protein [Russula earlei]
MDSSSTASFFVAWPSAPLTDLLVRSALLSLPDINSATIHSTQPRSFRKLIQWSTYDGIDHALTHSHHHDVLSSSYIIRKALIRKHFLSRSIRSYLTKHPDSVLRTAVPKTWEIEIAFSDELDDLWADELWDLSELLLASADADETKKMWWILKPGMADRGMGIRLFDSKEGLRRTLDEFDDDDEEEEEEEGPDCGEGRHDGNGDGDGPGFGAAAQDDDDTSVAVSQLRHFVIQEYLSRPLLLDPREVPLGDVVDSPRRPFDRLRGHKFHLRAYCVASGDLTLYWYTRMLALFSSKPYTPPARANDADAIDLAPHLTNSSLQIRRGEEGVRLFDELLGCHILSCEPGPGGTTLTLDHLVNVQDQVADTLAETFRAALESPIHFQPLPNAFELYGVDFLVEHIASESPQQQFQVKLLEINAEPAIELTGPRLTWILKDLFDAVAYVCVDPFVRDVPLDSWPVGETRHHLRKCLQLKVRGSS